MASRGLPVNATTGVPIGASSPAGTKTTAGTATATKSTLRSDQSESDTSGSSGDASASSASPTPGAVFTGGNFPTVESFIKAAMSQVKRESKAMPGIASLLSNSLNSASGSQLRTDLTTLKANLVGNDILTSSAYPSGDGSLNSADPVDQIAIRKYNSANAAVGSAAPSTSTAAGSQYKSSGAGTASAQNAAGQQQGLSGNNAAQQAKYGTFNPDDQTTPTTPQYKGPSVDLSNNAGILKVRSVLFSISFFSLICLDSILAGSLCLFGFVQHV